MSSEDMNGLNSQLVFQAEPMPFNCSTTPQRRVADPAPKTRKLCGFMDDKLFPVDRDRFFAHQVGDLRRSVFGDSRNWNGNGSARTGNGKESDEDDDDDEDDEDEVDDDVEGLVSLDDANKCNKTANPNSSSNNRSDQSGGGLKNGTNKLGNGKPNFGGTLLVKDGMVGPSGSNTGATQSETHLQGRLGNYSNAVTIAEHEGEAYYSQYLQGTERRSASGQKDLAMENECGFGRRDISLSGEPRESLRAILTDPMTGTLMDDAMILPCGHSFGSGGIKHVLRLKSCYMCSQSVAEDSIAQNLSLQAAVQAFRREEELLIYRSPKRRRERFEQDKGAYGDMTMDTPRIRGVQFPFAVTDRVIIKGNKRTPQRFVGREAVVTTQCLNGWYVVKTLDNAESVKLQYRSLSKVPNDAASKTITRKITPNWL